MIDLDPTLHHRLAEGQAAGHNYDDNLSPSANKRDPWWLIALGVVVVVVIGLAIGWATSLPPAGT